MFDISSYKEFLVYRGTDKVPNGQQGWYIKRGTPRKIREQLEGMSKQYRQVYGNNLIQGYEPKEVEE